MSPAEIDRYRAYLTVLARQQVPATQGAKLDASGVVQQTLLDAHQAADTFANLNAAQRLAWLRLTLARNLSDEYRRLLADKRDVRRDHAIAASVESSALGLERWLALDLPSPSRQADHAEQLLLVTAALAELPEAQRLAIEYHYFDRRPVADVAAALGKTSAAVAGLLKRGLQTLRQRLGQSHQ